MELRVKNMRGENEKSHIVAWLYEDGGKKSVRLILLNNVHAFKKFGSRVGLMWMCLPVWYLPHHSQTRNQRIISSLVTMDLKHESKRLFLARLFFKVKKLSYCDCLGVGGSVPKREPCLKTQKPFNIFKWNLVHMFLGIKHISIQSHITLAFIITELCPFSDLKKQTSVGTHSAILLFRFEPIIS